MSAGKSSTKHSPLNPGAVVGVVGGGQLGRYFVIEARRLGYQTWVLDPDANAPAMQLAEHKLVAAYDDTEALAQLGNACDAVTVEFENVPAQSLEQLAALCRVAPTADNIRIAQDRNLEKRTALQHGLTPVPYATISSVDNITAAVEAVGLPAILKTARLGYDGKGQTTCGTVADVEDAFKAGNGAVCVLERRINLQAEVSVVLARGFDDQAAVFPISENVHVDGILTTSTVPAQVSAEITDKAEELALKLASGLNYYGVLAVEFFIDDKGAVLFNEMAPRPHNSGHYTLDATVCSQFEQQLRVLCALPLGSTRLLRPVSMVNLLGDIWTDGEPDWLSLHEQAGAQLHLYGKSEPRPGRKMGHINCLSQTAEEALAIARQVHRNL